jgi:hypothetical protein
VVPLLAGGHRGPPLQNPVSLGLGRVMVGIGQELET